MASQVQTWPQTSTNLALCVSKRRKTVAWASQLWSPLGHFWLLVCKVAPSRRLWWHSPRFLIRCQTGLVPFAFGAPYAYECHFLHSMGKVPWPTMHTINQMARLKHTHRPSRRRQPRSLIVIERGINWHKVKVKVKQCNRLELWTRRT